MTLTKDTILMRHIANNGPRLPKYRTLLEDVKVTTKTCCY
jgi:hypothetical protein